MKQKFPFLTIVILITLILISGFVFAQENSEEEEDKPEGASSLNLCMSDSDCSNYCKSREPLFRGDYECYVKDCVSECVDIGQYTDGKGKCEANFEYYTDNINDLEIIEIARNYLISKVGKDYFERHYEYDPESIRKKIIKDQSEEYYNEHYTSNGVMIGDRGADVLFVYKGEAHDQESYKTFRLLNNEISISHCKGKNFYIARGSAVLEPIEITISKQEAIEIARNEGFVGEFEITNKLMTIQSDESFQSKSGLNFFISRPAWVLTKNKNIGCDEFKTLYVDMFEGKYVDKLYDGACYLESETKVISDKSKNKGEELSILNYIYYLILGILILIAIILFFKFRKK